MAERDLINAFNDCIDRMSAGQDIESCLRAYPQYAAALRPMLEAGALVRRMRMTTDDIQAAQDRVRIRYQQSIRSAPRHSRIVQLRLLANIAAVLILFFVIIGSGGLLSQASLPGDALYGIKRLSEQIGSILDTSEVYQRELMQRRADEVNNLLELARPADVSFQGAVTHTEGDIWEIAMLPVQVSAETPGYDVLSIGARVEVEGYTTTAGTLIARRITLLEAPPPPTPTSTATSTPSPTVTSSATATTTPSQTASATLTMTPTATMTSTVSATVTATASATASSTATNTATSTASRTPTNTATPRPTLSSSATTCAPSQPAGWVQYRVQAGDTLSGLAANRGITLEQAMTVNCLTNAGFIFVGQLLYLPPAVNTDTPDDDDNNAGDDNQGGDNSGSGPIDNGQDDNSSNDDDNDESDDDDGGDDDD
jgi:LysM repeat protein